MPLAVARALARETYRQNLTMNPGGLPAETALYQPIKAFLERQGYEVKGEVRNCDVVACRGDEKPIIIEMKLRFNLALVLQGIDRLMLSDRVYLAVPRKSRGLSPESAGARRLCRRLGLGLILVGARGVTVVEEPVPYRPRPAKRRTELLLGEFARRQGDMNIGGQTRAAIVTAYRQDALRCARALAEAGAMRLAELRAATGVPDAGAILQRDVYGWFTRVGRGTYALSPAGTGALVRFADAVAVLDPPSAAAVAA